MTLLLKYIGFNFISTLLAIVLIPLVANTIGSKEMGVVGYILAYCVISQPLVSFCSEKLIQTKRYLSNELHEYLDTLMVMALASLISIVLMLMLSVSFIGGEYYPLIFIVPFLSYFRFLKNIYLQEMIFRKEAFKYGMANFLVRLLTLIFVSTFFLIDYIKASAYIVSILMSEFIILLYFYCDGFRISFKINKDVLIKVLIYSIPLILSELFLWGMNEGGKLYIERYAFDKLGSVVVSFSIVAIYVQLCGVFINAFMDEILSFKKRNLAVIKLNSLFFVAMLLGGVGFYCFFDLFFGQEYKLAHEMFYVMLLAGFFKSSSTIPSILITKQENSMCLLKSSVLGCVSFVCVLVFCEFDSDILLVSYSFLISFFIYLSSLWFYLVYRL